MGKLDKSHCFNASNLRNALDSFDSYGGTDDDTDSDDDARITAAAAYYGGEKPADDNSLDGSCDDLFFDEEAEDDDDDDDEGENSAEFVEPVQIDDALEAAEGTLEALVRLDRAVHRRDSMVGGDQKKKGKSKLKKIFKKKKKNKDKKLKAGESSIESAEFEHLQHVAQGSQQTSSEQSQHSATCASPRNQAVVETCEAFGNLLSMMHDEKKTPKKALPVSTATAPRSAAGGDTRASPTPPPVYSEANKSVVENETPHHAKKANVRNLSPAVTPANSTRKHVDHSKKAQPDEQKESTKDEEDVTNSNSPKTSPTKPQASKRRVMRRESLYGCKQKSEDQDDLNNRRTRQNDLLASEGQSGAKKRSNSNDPLGQSQHRGARRNRSADPLGPSEHRGTNQKSNRGRSSPKDEEPKRSRSSDLLGPSEHRSGGGRRPRSRDPLGPSEHREARRNRSRDPLGSSEHRKTTRRSNSKEPAGRSEQREARRNRSNDLLGPSEHRKPARRSSVAPAERRDTSSKNPTVSSEQREVRRSRSSDPLGPSEHRKTRRSSVEPRQRPEVRRTNSSSDISGLRDQRGANRSRRSGDAESREARRSNSYDPLAPSEHRGSRRRPSSRDPLARSEHRTSRGGKPLSRSGSLRKLDSDEENSPQSRDRRGTSSGHSRKPQSLKRVSHSAGELDNMDSDSRPSSGRNPVWTSAPNRRTNRRTSRMMTAAGIQLELQSTDEQTGTGRRTSLVRNGRGVGRSRSFQDTSEAEHTGESVEELLRSLAAPQARRSPETAAVDAAYGDDMGDFDEDLDQEYVIPVKDDNADSDDEDYKPPPRPSSLSDVRDSNQRSDSGRRLGLLQRMESVGSFFGKGRGNVGSGLQALSPQKTPKEGDPNRPNSEKLDDILFSLRRENKRNIMGKQKSSRQLIID